MQIEKLLKCYANRSSLNAAEKTTMPRHATKTNSSKCIDAPCSCCVSAVDQRPPHLNKIKMRESHSIHRKMARERGLHHTHLRHTMLPAQTTTECNVQMDIGNKLVVVVLEKRGSFGKQQNATSPKRFIHKLLILIYSKQSVAGAVAATAAAERMYTENPFKSTTMKKTNKLSDGTYPVLGDVQEYLYLNLYIYISYSAPRLISTMHGNVVNGVAHG